METKKVHIKKSAVIWILLAVVIIVIVSSEKASNNGKVVDDPEQEIMVSSQVEESEPEEILSEEEKNQLVRDSIDSTVADWITGTTTFEEASEILNDIISTSNSELSEYAETKLHYITVENNGNITISIANDHIEAEKYPEAYKMLNKIDPAYSGYAEVDTLYESCTDKVMNAVSTPETKKDFDEFIQLLEDCYAQFKFDDFLKRKNELSEERKVFIDVEETINLATALFDANEIEESFVLLALGLEKYPDNEKLATALVDYHDHYIISITQKAVELCEKEEYKEALAIVEAALEEYDCDEFQMLKESIREEKNFLYRIKNDIVDAFISFDSGWTEEKFDVKQAVGDAGSYIIKSGKKLFLGDYEKGEVTLLSTGGNIAASLAGVDILFDLRDLSYDITHWGEEEYFAVWLAADIVALIPVIGVVKYVSHLKPAVNGIGELVDSVADINKNTQNISELADTIKSVTKTGDSIVETIDNAKDAAKTVESSKGILSNIFKEYKVVETINQKYLGKIYEDTGVKFKLSKATYSDGRKIKGVFPVFESFCDVKLPKDLYKASFYDQKKNCLEQLQKKTKYPWSDIRKNFTEEQLEDIANGILPEGFTWHHNEKEGVMQLVSSEIHDKIKHTGGMSLWGRGY